MAFLHAPSRAAAALRYGHVVSDSTRWLATKAAGATVEVRSVQRLGRKQPHRSFSFLQQAPPPPQHPVLRASSPLSPPLPPFFVSPTPSAWQQPAGGEYTMSPRLRINPNSQGDSSTTIRDLVDKEGWLPTADILEGLLNHKAPPASSGGGGSGVVDEIGDPAQGPTPPAPVLAVKRTFQPSTIRKKRKHGFLVRLRDEEGRKTIHRRRLKGRSRLSM